VKYFIADVAERADEVEDGIAACAQAQAKLWAEAAKEAKEGGEGAAPAPVDPGFLRELQLMGEDSHVARSRGAHPLFFHASCVVCRVSCVVSCGG
jgi:hypothetical protein